MNDDDEDMIIGMDRVSFSIRSPESSTFYYTPPPPEHTLLPIDGIPLAYLDDFIHQCGGRDALANKSTNQILQEYILPATNNFRCSYCNLLRIEQPNYILDANVYVVHAGDMRFLDLIDTLKDYSEQREIKYAGELEEYEEIFIWIDIFSVNYHMHPTIELDFDWFNSLKLLIGEIHHTVVVLPSWQDPLPFVRTWCLFELYCSIDTESKVEFIMSEKSLKSLKSDLKRGKCEDATPFRLFLSTINIRKTNTRIPTDKEKILRYLKSSRGYDKVNTTILQETRNFILQETKLLLKNDSNHSLDGGNTPLYEDEKIHLKLILANIYNQSNELNKAKELYEQCCHEREELLGHEHLYTLQSKHKLIEFYWKINELEKGETLCYEVYEIRKHLLGDDHPDTLTSLKTLANLLGDQKKYDKAIEYHEICLEKRLQKLGSNHPSTIQSYKMLAILYSQQGKHEQSLKYILLNIEKAKLVFGVDHPHTLSSLYQLANIYHLMNKLLQCEEVYYEIYEISKTTLGDYHSDTLKVMSKITQLLAEQKKYSNVDFFLECYEKKKAVYTENHIDTLQAMNNVANAYYMQGKYHKGEKFYLQCLEISKDILGLEHPDTIGTMYNLANLLYKQRKYTEAETMYEQSYELRCKVLGENHGQTITTMASLAYIYYKQQKTKKAEELYQQVLVKQQDLYGKEHMKTVRTMMESVYIERSKYDQAEDLLMEGYRIKMLLLGEDHPETLTLMDDLGYLLYTNHKYLEAEMLLGQCVNKRKKQLGEEHADTLLSIHNLAMLYKDQAKFQQAEELFYCCYNNRKKLFGETHSNTTDTMLQLASVYYQRGKYLEAEEMYLTCLEKIKKLNDNNNKLMKMITSNLHKVRDMIQRVYGPGYVSAASIAAAQAAANGGGSRRPSYSGYMLDGNQALTRSNSSSPKVSSQTSHEGSFYSQQPTNDRFWRPIPSMDKDQYINFTEFADGKL